MGPPRNGTIRLNSVVYSPNLHAVSRVVEFYRNGKARLQDPHNARRRPILDPADLVAIPVDNSAEYRDLYNVTNEIDKLKLAFPSSLTC